MKREKQAEQLLREELGSLYNPGRGTKVALVFPNSYYLGMSSLGFQVILDEINGLHDVSCERVFFSSDGQDSQPRSVETQRPLSEFDVIGFSISFELDYLNVARILRAAGIPIRAKDRSLRDPLVIAGGIACSFNPEPLSSIVDAFVIGDGEEVVQWVISEYQAWRQTQNTRQYLLNTLSEIDGAYVPLLYRADYSGDGTLSKVQPSAGVTPRVEGYWAGELDKFDTASKFLTPNTEFARSFLVEVSRGCAHRCRFCVASHVKRYRIRPKDAVLKLAQSELAQKADRIGLLGSSVADHPQIDEIAAGLVNMGKKITVASMRADSVSDALLDALAASGQGTITLAPEAASARLRGAIGKNILMDRVLEVIKSAMKSGILNVKLYFMVGLPTETSEDVDGIVTVAERARRLMNDSPRPRPSVSPRLTISISPFVPKPHTPFQWCQMENAKALSLKLQLLRRKLGGIGGVRVTSGSAKWSAIQGVLARGDRRLGNVLCDIAAESISWSQALKKNGLNHDLYLHRPRQIDELLPWDHLNIGVPKSRLSEQFLAFSG